MSQTYVPDELRRKVSEQARYRCGYCLTAAAIAGAPMEIDHIVPQSLGGLTEEGNLWLACPLCNRHKADRIAALDPLTAEIVRLFNPRYQRWQEHFAWSAEGDRIVGLTSCGRATVGAFALNRPTLIRARQAWVQAGWHPPKE